MEWPSFSRFRRPMIDISKRGLGIFLVLVMVVSVFSAGAVMAAPADEMSYDGDNAAPNPTIQVDEMTVDRHPADEGFSDDAMAGYYDDSGEWVEDPEFAVNTSADTEEGTNVNPYSFKPGHVEDPDFDMFPRTGTDDDGDQLASALNADEWSTDEGDTDGTVTVEDSEVAEGADGVRISTDSVADGETATAEYDNWSSELDSDEEKRVLQVAGDVDEMDSDANMTIALEDEDGDYKEISAGTAFDADEEDVLADETGDSFVTQVKLSDLDTEGDGDFNNIEKLVVDVNDADADVTFSWIDAEAKGMDKLGEKTVEDDDGEYVEDEEIYQAQGAIEVNSMETVNEEFDNAVVNDVTFPAEFEAAHLQGEQGDEAAFDYEFKDAEDYPSYDKILDVSYRLEAPTAIDLSYSGVSLVMEQGHTTERYNALQIAEGVGDDSSLADADYTDKLGVLSGNGDTVELDDTVETGQNIAFNSEIKLTDEEADEIQNVGGAPVDGGAEDAGIFGGIIDFVTSIPGALMTLGGGILGFRWLKG